MSDRSRRPVSSPSKTADDIEQQVLEIRDSHPAWGHKIRKRMELLGVSRLPSVSTTAPARRCGVTNKAVGLNRR